MTMHARSSISVPACDEPIELLRRGRCDYDSRLRVMQRLRAKACLRIAASGARSLGWLAACPSVPSP
jgi:hypothetical protein